MPRTSTVLFIVAAVSAPAGALAQTVVNPGFESPAQNANGFTYADVTGWTAVGVGTNWGVFFPTQATWQFTAPSGNQVLYTNGPTIEQTLTTLTAAGATYTLLVDVVNRPVYSGHSYFVELYAGTALLARDNNTLSPPVGGYLTSTISATIPATGPLVGQPLKIRLGGADQTNFDNIRFGYYANCDGSTAAPVLNVQDFTCFLQRFAAGSAYANCDGSTAAPVLNVQDFTCFLQHFAAGCG